MINNFFIYVMQKDLKLINFEDNGEHHGGSNAFFITEVLDNAKLIGKINLLK